MYRIRYHMTIEVKQSERLEKFQLTSFFYYFIECFNLGIIFNNSSAIQYLYVKQCYVDGVQPILKR